MSGRGHNSVRKKTIRNRSRGIALTPESRRRFRSRRRAAHLNVEQLARNAGVSEKLIKNIENAGSGRNRFDESKLTALCEALECSLDGLLLGEEVAGDRPRPPTDFESLVRLTEALDEGLLPVIRDLRLKPKAVDEAFQDLLRERLRQRGLALDEFLRELHGRRISEMLVATLPEPDLHIDIADGFERVGFRFDGHTLDVTHPTLLWDCHCDTPGARKRASSCPIHAHRSGAELEARFASGQAQMTYRGGVFRWRCSRALWPPSIDSFAMYEDLRNFGLIDDRVTSVLDIGAGTGFLGIMLALENPNVRRLDLSDWLLTPMVYGRVNWLINHATRKHVRTSCKLGLFTRWLDSAIAPYDVVLCNPPYLPLLDGFDDLGVDSTVAGTDLLVHTILHARSLAQRVFVQFSHIADKEATQAAKQAGIRLRPVAEPRMVPFRVPVIWQRPEYLDALSDQRDLMHRPGERHPYWHHIRTYLIE